MISPERSQPDKLPKLLFLRARAQHSPGLLHPALDQAIKLLPQLLHQKIAPRQVWIAHLPAQPDRWMSGLPPMFFSAIAPLQSDYAETKTTRDYLPFAIPFPRLGLRFPRTILAQRGSYRVPIPT